MPGVKKQGSMGSFAYPEPPAEGEDAAEGECC